MTRSGERTSSGSLAAGEGEQGGACVDGMAIEWIINTGYEEEMIQKLPEALREQQYSSHPYGWSRFPSRKAGRDRSASRPWKIAWCRRP